LPLTAIASASTTAAVIIPFPRHVVENVLKQCRFVLVPEMNIGQISREVKRVNQFGTHVEKYNRIDGQLITPDEICVKLLTTLG